MSSESRSSTEESVDPRLLEQAQQQIRGLVDEVGRLARQDLSPESFFAEYLARVTAALAALGGVVWLLREGSRLELLQQTNLREVGLEADPDALSQHHDLAREVVKSGEGTLLAPRAAAGTLVNPGDALLLLAPVKVADETRGVVEIFQRPGAPDRTQRGYLRFLLQVGELAGDYLKNRQLRTLSDRQALWQQLEQFIRGVHASLDPHQVAATIANEGRRLIGCDRVSVALATGTRCRIDAISGQDAFDARAVAVRLMNELASVVVAGGEPVWYRGDTSDFPPQVEQAIDDYVNETHSKHVAILPLRREPEANVEAEGEEPAATPVGALIIEQIEDTRPREGFEQRVALVADHAAAALANAMEHEGLFLMPLWRAIGKNRWVVEARTLPKTVSIGIGMLVLLVALVIIPWKFSVSSTGTMLPVSRREVFAPLDGTVATIHVKHGDHVNAGDLLVELRNTDLEVAISDVTGQRMATQEQILAIDRARTIVEKGKAASLEERNRLEGERSELKQKLASLDQQLEVYHEKRRLLEVRSPIAGQVTTWNIEQLLRQRPVRQGQVLLSVADTSGDWELELRMPEDRIGYVVEAQRDLDPGEHLDVTYRLATAPGVDHDGQVVDIHGSAELRGEEGNVVLVKVRIDKGGLTDLRPGADVMAKIDCGWRSVGYVLFHDVLAFVQRALFRL
ncbi:MAG TPA: efflux RND transporter periplasmic adaptor subunit [Pirellulales bacterium]|jgi:multidrug efflux pump subunit AcrA (membrane-fusion protein)|nr:efflux RND transporter periplasmic adaptor subunit [Pirellulales bacterium]